MKKHEPVPPVGQQPTAPARPATGAIAAHLEEIEHPTGAPLWYKLEVHQNSLAKLTNRSTNITTEGIWCEISN
jgi:hypothetical protein